MNKRIRRRIFFAISAFLYLTISQHTALTVLAAPDYAAEAEERKQLPVQSNQIVNWPDGPKVSAQSAVLLEAETGTILYAKNIHERAYPASTTKLMTCLIAAENAGTKETVRFSHDAVFGIERDSSNIGIDAGEAMPLEECLYGIMVASANEVANAVAEHVGGSMDAFAEMMNQKAAELGCENTHFVNAHGLYDDNHYTTAYDLALIGRAFFENELLSKVGNTASYHFKATPTQPDDFIARNKHKLISGEIACEGIRGGKTGYTDEARQTLVTCAERNGMKLICVVMKEESPDQFNDTVKLMDYGFANFAVTNIYENEEHYQVQDTHSFHTAYDIFGNSEGTFSLNKNSFVILPKTLHFTDLSSEITYEGVSGDEVARIDYSYLDNYLGSATIHLLPEAVADSAKDTATFTKMPIGECVTTADGEQIIFINVIRVILFTLLAGTVLIVLFLIRDLVTNYTILDSAHGKSRKKRPRRRKRNRDKGPVFPSSRFNDFGL